VKKVRVILAPPQDGRIVVLGAVLWPDRITLHAVVESDGEEIADRSQEDEQFDMFDLTDDLGGTYENGGSGGTSEDHVQEHRVRFEPGVPEEATKLTVTLWVRHEVRGVVELPL
jgi:hypothetical protein